MLSADSQHKRTKIIDLLKTADIAGAYEVLRKVQTREELDDRIKAAGLGSNF